MVKLLTRAEAAQELRVSTRGLRRLNIPVVRIGRKPLYDKKDLDAFLAKQDAMTATRSKMSPLGQEILDEIGLREDVPRAARVYFIRAAQFVKIGYSRNVPQRLDAIRNGSPHNAELIGDIRGDLNTEKAIHRVAKRHRHHREWFSLDMELSVAITELCDAEMGK